MYHDCSAKVVNVSYVQLLRQENANNPELQEWKSGNIGMNEYMNEWVCGIQQCHQIFSYLQKRF
jgi:hypothetical protein